MARINYKRPISVLGFAKKFNMGGMWLMESRIFENLVDVKNAVLKKFQGWPRHRTLVRMEQWEGIENGDPVENATGAVKVFHMVVGDFLIEKPKKATTKLGRATSKRMKALTAEAKKLRKEKPKMTWPMAMKKAAKNLKKKSK